MRYADRPCLQCGQVIPETKKEKARSFHSVALYCSDQCQKNAQRKRKAIRKRLQDGASRG
jgi:hypothetical protein